MNHKGQLGIVLLVILAVFVAGILIVAGMYNSLVQNDVAAGKAWGNVQTAYQRRADLIPNLVATVQGVANFEKSTYTAVTEARSGWTNAKTSEEKVAAAQSMDSALSRLLVVMENYPDLKANQNFLALQDELSGTENRVKFERDNYNKAVQAYQLSVRSFPTNIMAGMFGFSADKWKMFEADQGAQNAPKVGNFS
jgi:LemA protein